MEDFDDIKKEFLAEANDHLSNIEDDVLEIEKQGAHFNGDIVNHLFRAIHSVKGSSSFLELKNVTGLSHALENAIDMIRQGRLVPDENVAGVLLQGIDKLKHLIRNLNNQHEIDVSNEINLLQRIFSGPEPIPADPVPTHASDKNIRKEASIAEKSLPVQDAEMGEPYPGDRVMPEDSGLYIYSCTIDLIAECDDKNRLPAELFKNIGILGEVVKAEFDPCGGLSDDDDGRLMYSFILSTVIEDQDMLTGSLEISPIDIRRLTMSEKDDVGSAAIAERRKAFPSRTSPDSRTAKKGRSGENKQVKREPLRLRERVSYDSGSDDRIGKKEIATVQDEAPALYRNNGSNYPDKNSSTSFVKGPSDIPVKISLALLDRLMNLAGELVLVRNQNMQAVENNDIDQLRSIAKKLNIVTSDLQSNIMKTRMQKVDTVFSRYVRVVRDLSLKMNKLIDFEIVGREVELDKNIIEAISDPLTHLVRNAVDHGIETPEERERKGKQKTGKIELSAFHQAGYVIIAIKDDGRGIDPERLKKTALSKGMLTQQQADEMSNIDAISLIFKPGFSTAATLTDISGRGVGMDVVKTNFQKLGGVIDIHSKINEGTVIEIRLPLTLTIMKALIVTLGGHYYAIPQINIAEVVWLHGEDVYDKINSVNNQEVFSLRGNLIPVIRLSDLLGVSRNYVDLPDGVGHDERINSPDARPAQLSGTHAADVRVKQFGIHDNSLYIIVLKLGTFVYGMLIDAIVDTEEIVVKPLHRQLKRCMAYSGTTVRGDGSIAIILDIIKLTELAMFNTGMLEDRAPAQKALVEDQQSVVVFSVGGSDCFAIATFLIRHIEKVTRERLMVSNGREYILFQENVVPVIRIERSLDAIEGSYGDDLYVIIVKAQKPIGILAAEIFDTAMIKSTFDTTTISRPGIIGVELIFDRLTLVLDVFQIVERIEPGWFTKSEGAGGAAKRVLLVEDTNFYSALIRSFLCGNGFEVVLAHDGNEGLEAARSDDFDLIISDIEMPGMDGIEFAKKIRSTEKYQNVQMLAISGLYSNEEGRRVAREAGFDNFISKLNKESLMDSLKMISC